MSLSTEFLDELRARTQLSALVGKTLRLQKAGHEWKACCPFHNEKSASFYVNDDKAFWHCFGCGAHGDAIRWLSDTRGLEFLDAVRELADAAGLEMPARDEQRDEQSAGIHAIVSRAEAWFREQLNGLAGGEARAYLESRGVGAREIEAFGIGYVPDGRNRLRQALGDLGDDVLIEAGLLVAPDDGREPYDRFRSRIIFPIRDVRGRTLGFSGRIVGPGEPKYLNSPEGPIFSKGRTLFNLDRAARAARQSGRIVVVEGQMDVVGVATVGIDELVAPLGTALTEAQIGLLWRYSPTPLLCFDGDTAGRRASVKAALRALPGLQAGRSLSFVSMPAGKDPFDLARSGGAAAIEAAIARAEPLVGLIWEHERAAGPLDTPEQKVALRQRLVEHARSIEDPEVRREYEREFRARVDRLFERPARAPRRPDGPKGRRKQRPARTSPIEPVDIGALGRKMVTAILRGLVRFPEVLSDEAERASGLPIGTAEQRLALDLMLDATFGGRPVEVREIDDLFPDDRGWKGLRLAFLSPKVDPAHARTELRNALDLVLAQAGGADTETLARMARDLHPEPTPPEFVTRQSSLL